MCVAILALASHYICTTDRAERHCILLFSPTRAQGKRGAQVNIYSCLRSEYCDGFGPAQCWIDWGSAKAEGDGSHGYGVWRPRSQPHSRQVLPSKEGGVNGAHVSSPVPVEYSHLSSPSPHLMMMHISRNKEILQPVPAPA